MRLLLSIWEIIPPMRARFLSAGTGRGTVIPRVESAKAKWRLSMEHFFTIQPDHTVQARKEERKELPDPQSSGPDDPLRMADPALRYIFDNTRGHKCLVFSNSREECEEIGRAHV